MDEGYIKFQLHWEEGAAPSQNIQELIQYRDQLYQKGWIGFDKVHKVGFGNISLRLDRSDHFIISSTQTGHFKQTQPEHYCEVLKCDIPANTVWCLGPLRASSESMSHAAVYSCSEKIGAIIHIHQHELWMRSKHQIPTTSDEVAYGTPEMAYEIQRLYRETSLPQDGVLAMAGHEDGIISFGEDLAEAYRNLERISL
ncbi:class II aldolase/adducin family protein [bacterium SCSIO 12741]|nr:class II aldolase/adducin family protein [bacterium SCSIO 12741]